MASKPGILTDWPWKPLGSFKYMLLSPWIAGSMYSIVVKEWDAFNLMILPLMLSRALHNQLWISLSRYRTAVGTNRIVDKAIEFEQVDRESNWDDQILFNAILFYLGNKYIPGASHLPIWRMDGVVITILYALFVIPLLITMLTGTASIIAIAGYTTYIDFMNSMGHCNFELFPNWIFSFFPPLKYLMYTPSFHSLHHTQFRTNYSLFMPIYDYMYGTMDKTSDSLYELSLKRKEESPNVVHLTHLITPESIYHLRLGFASFASRPYSPVWYLWLLWPVTLWSMMLTWIYGRTFVVERNRFDKLKLQTWCIPKYTLQSEELNMHGEVYVKKHPKLKVKLVDGSSLAVAVLLNTIPKGTTQLLIRGQLNKVAVAVAVALSEKGIQVAVSREDEYEKLDKSFGSKSEGKLVMSKSYSSYKIWLVGDEMTEEDQQKAAKGTVFIPFSQFPPKRVRKDCLYHSTPAMQSPRALENVDSCENWLPRRVMSVSRIAGIVHGLEGWEEHECGSTMSNIDKLSLVLVIRTICRKHSMASKPGILTDWPWKPLGSFKLVRWSPSLSSLLHGVVALDRREHVLDGVNRALIEHRRPETHTFHFLSGEATEDVAYQLGAPVNGVVIINSILCPVRNTGVETVLTGTASLTAIAGYSTYIDLMNNMDHCNFELIASWIFSVFPPQVPNVYSISEELNMYGEVYVKKHPKLKVKPAKVAVAVVVALSEKGIQKLDKSFGSMSEGKLVKSKSYSSYKIWLVGDEITEEDQRKATKGTLFIHFSEFPPKILHKDCFYHTTPAMQSPRTLENVDSCENWLPRRVTCISCIAGYCCTVWKGGRNMNVVPPSQTMTKFGKHVSSMDFSL
ncbi:Protein CER1-like 1 [Hibiscus syriacus]|uniref:Protein CER1-like 1 n=1 Tax=Hibiscus syriacus TaxID=106335 RepID=A0A6A2Z446_HIBSY|nr:Protein CER1-like 1 [Hibiscus syriacus]